MPFTTPSNAKRRSNTNEEHQYEPNYNTKTNSIEREPFSTRARSDAMALTTRKSAAIPWRSPRVQVVLASTLLAPLGVPLVAPALPVVSDAFGITDAETSLLISAYFVTGIFLSPFIGLLTDRVGRRRVLVPSLFVFSLAGIPLALAPDFTTLLVVRLAQGTAAAGIFITTVTLISDTFEESQRNAVLGVNAAALFVGAAAYPILGGALAGVGWNAPFLVYLAGLPVCLFAFRYLEEPESDRETRGLAYLRDAFAALPAGKALALYGAAFATEALVFGTIITTLPFLLTAAYGLSPVWIGSILTAATVVSALVASQNGRLAQYFSNYQLVALAFVCYGIGLLGAWLAPSPVFVGLAVLVYGAGLGIPLPSIDAAISGLVPMRLRAGALSLRNSATFLGRAAGPVVFVGIAVTTGYRTLLLVAGVFVLGTGLLAVLVTSQTTRTVESSEKVT